jgi:hypothetical protein
MLFYLIYIIPFVCRLTLLEDSDQHKEIRVIKSLLLIYQLNFFNKCNQSTLYYLLNFYPVLFPIFKGFNSLEFFFNFKLFIFLFSEIKKT